MSASDKKQQKKAALVEGLTQKQQREQAEARAAKQKKTVYTIVGVICAGAAAALLIWNGISTKSADSHKNETAAVVGGVNYSVSDLQYYYMEARNQERYMYQFYSQYGSSYPFNPYLDDGAQWYNEAEGKTYADYFRETALESLQQITALCAAAETNGYTLSEAGKEAVESNLAQIDVICAQYGWTRSAYFASQYGNGVTEKVFVKNLSNTTLASEYSSYHKDQITYDDDALQAYYEEHPDTLDSYDYRSFFISGVAEDPTDENGDPLKDEDGNTITATDEENQAALEEAKKKAEEAVSLIETAEDREAAFIAAAPEYVAENLKEAYADSDHSLQTGVFGNTLSSSSAAIASWLMDSSRKAGDVTMIESGVGSTSGLGYTVVLFLDRYLVKDNAVNIRHILIQAETTADDELDENSNPIPSQEAMDAAKAEAESILAKWEAGDKTAASFGELANEYSDDPGSNTKGGRYAYVSQGTMFDAFDQWIFDSSRQPGETGLVENPQSGQQGWHIIYFEDTDDSWKSTATSAKQNTEQNEWLDEIYASVEAVAADAMQYVGSENTAVPTASASPAESAEPSPSESPAA